MSNQDIFGPESSPYVREGEVKEMSWFARQNTLADFFHYEPVDHCIYGPMSSIGLVDNTRAVHISMLGDSVPEEVKKGEEEIPQEADIDPWKDYKLYQAKTVELDLNLLNQIKKHEEATKQLETDLFKKLGDYNIQINLELSDKLKMIDPVREEKKTKGFVSFIKGIFS